MEPWMLAVPLVVIVTVVPLAIRINASRRLRRRLEPHWSPIAERWQLEPVPARWYSALRLRGTHEGRVIRLIAHRALLGQDVRFWRTWLVVIVELQPPRARLAPARSDGYIVSANDDAMTFLRPGFGRALDLIPTKGAEEIIPGVRVDGRPPEVTEEVRAILERWFVPGHGFIADEGISLAWRPGTSPDADRVERALQDATTLAAWLTRPCS